MRILYLSSYYTTHDHRFLSSLAKTDHKVYYVQVGKQPWVRETRELPTEIERVTSPLLDKEFAWSNMMSVIWAVNQVIAKIEPDVIHAGPLHKSAFFASHGTHAPLVSMSWGSDLLYEGEINKFISWTIKAALNQSTLLLCDCETVRKKAISYGFPHERIVMFPWGIDLSEFPFVDRHRAAEDHFTVLSTRHWDMIHNVRNVVDAYIIAATQIPQIKMILLSEGPQKSEIVGALTQAGLLDEVEMPGFVPYAALPQYFRRSDLYVSASISDGSSVSLMEALATGVPAVVTDIESNREWIDEGIEGWTYPLNDAHALADRMIYAYEHRAQLKRMGLLARQRAERMADWELNFQKLLEAYDQAVELKKPL